MDNYLIMPATSKKQFQMIQAIRSKYGSKNKAPEDKKWAFDSEWTDVNYDKLPENKLKQRYKKFFENNLQDFIKKNIGKKLAIYKKGRWGTYHWEISTEAGDYQKIDKIATDTEEEALAQYYNKYIIKK